VLSQNCRNKLLAAYCLYAPPSVCLSVRMQQLDPPLDGFSRNSIFEIFSNICRQIRSLIKIWQQQRVLYYIKTGSSGGRVVWWTAPQEWDPGLDFFKFLSDLIFLSFSLSHKCVPRNFFGSEVEPALRADSCLPSCAECENEDASPTSNPPSEFPWLFKEIFTFAFYLKIIISH
jgi:hypothetical protein